MAQQAGWLSPARRDFAARRAAQRLASDVTLNKEEREMFEFQKFSQTDPSWKGTLLGFDNESTIGGFGCLLTCVTMAATGFGYAETPASLNEKLKALGPNVGFMSAMLVWGGIARALPGVTLRRLADCDTKPGYQYHWLILYGKKDGDYLLQDPYPYPASTQETLLTRSRYAFAG